MLHILFSNRSLSMCVQLRWRVWRVGIYTGLWWPTKTRVTPTWAHCECCWSLMDQTPVSVCVTDETKPVSVLLCESSPCVNYLSFIPRVDILLRCIPECVSEHGLEVRGHMPVCWLPRGPNCSCEEVQIHSHSLCPGGTHMHTSFLCSGICFQFKLIKMRGSVFCGRTLQTT